MKKFTFMLLAAFIAVSSWAGLPTDRLVKQAPAQLTGLQTAPAKQVTPKKAATVRLQAPANNRMAAKTRTGARKAPKKVGITDLLNVQWMLCSEYYEYDSEAGGLVEAAPAAGGRPITISTTAPVKENKIEWVAAEQGYENAQTITEFKISETINATVAKGEGSNDPAYYDSGTALRLYANNTLTITSEEPMVKIEFTLTGSAKQMQIDADKGEYALVEKLGTWTGEENEVTFTVPDGSGNQARIQKITIYFADEESEEEASSETPTIYIYGFTSSATEAIEATINTTVDEELQAQGVIAELSIADGQTLFVNDTYGPVLLTNVSEDGPITAYVYSDGYIMINALWTDILGGDGQYAGYMLSGIYNYSMVMPVNGTMTWAKSGATNEVPVVIVQDPGNIKNVTVYNFADEETAVNVTMKAGNKFVIESQLMFDAGTTYGQFYTYATDGSSVSETITGTGTEDALTFDGGWTLYAPSTGYWYGLLDAATIAYTDGSQFEYPVIPDVAATPANPDILQVGNYDSEKGYGYVLLDVPAVDVDGNDILEDKLYYQLYSDIDGDIQPITFTTDLYTKLEEDMSIIPFTFTDGYDFDVNNGSKVVYLNYNFNSMYTRIGVKSIYAGGDETNESEIAWVELEQLVELPEGVEAEDWALEGFWGDGSDGNDVFRATEVAFDGTDIYVKGLPYYFEDAWLMGTLDTESGIAIFPSGQLVGEDDYGKEYIVGFDGSDFCDIVYAYDAEAKTLTQVTEYVLESQTKSGLDEEGEFAFWGLWEVSYLHAGEPMALEPVEAPEGLETETYLFTANVVTAGEDDEADGARRAEGDVLTMMAFNFNMMDVATSSSSSTDGDITEPLVLTEENVTLTISPADEHYTNAPNRFWGTNDGPQLRVYSGTLTVEAPEGATLTQIVFNHNGKWGATNSADSGTLTNDADAKAATWTGEAQKVVFTIGQYNEETGKYTSGNSQINSIDVNYIGTEEPAVDEPNYSYQMQVGFDGNDVYFKGFSDNTADMWAKGMLSEDGKTVTIPAKQYMGFLSSLFSTYDYYVTAIGEDGYEDIVLNYDADTNTFTTDQTIMLNGSIFVYYPYQTFTEVVITKMPEFAATPADPSINNYKFEGTSYPYIEFVIPAKDVDGNDILTAKLFYTVWIEEDGVEKPFVVLADEYRDVTEDMTEVPYDWDDSYDIYKGGSRVYINPVSAIDSWTKFGIQSIYYGGNERNTSNIVWMENPVYTGITDVNFNNQKVVVFDLQGRRVAAPAKGLYIVNGKKVVLK